MGTGHCHCEAVRYEFDGKSTSVAVARFAAPFLLSAWLPFAWSAELSWSDAQQLVLVTTPDWDSSQGTLRTFVRTEAGWKEVDAASSVVIGRAGAAWGVGLHGTQAGPRKREGDGRSPAGAFAVGAAFGYADAVSTALHYEPMDSNDWCVDVSASPHYNRIVDSKEVGVDAVAGSTEPMRRDLHVNGDQLYKIGFVIKHNPANERDAGSCIFAHVWKSADVPTAGCTAMAEPAMSRLLSWLRPEAAPVFVLLPMGEYARLRDGWGLPEIAPSG
jgi:L,D-peptidoglycan transpeptidase YkuD (ErfK/YbiS/YcfS/YnhG family)